MSNTFDYFNFIDKNKNLVNFRNKIIKEKKIKQTKIYKNIFSNKYNYDMYIYNKNIKKNTYDNTLKGYPLY
tara:strand:+ start:150 stop:362 length:213 start_codon:yes stop_codon:yes gene_type:complete